MTEISPRRMEGKYEILAKLGEGGMGAVYKVRHKLLDEIRVVKMMRPQLGEDEALKARFFHEARVANQLRHTNIAQLYDFSLDDDGVAFIVMEYVSGVNLETVVRSGSPTPSAPASPPVSVGLALEIARQSLRGIGFLHTKGFVHRDISPDNLMLTEGEEGEPLIKLLDLGIAKSLTGVGGPGGVGGLDLTRSGAFLGKLRYAPPEQFAAEGAVGVDARGDLYSFAVVLYELLTGRYPIQGKDSMSLIAGHLHFPPLDFAASDPQGRLPPGLRAIVLKSLAKKPEERFASAQDFSRSLTAYRSLGDIAPDELARVLSRAGVAQVRGTHAGNTGRGSTQNQLDDQFGSRTTPAQEIGDLTQARLEARKAPKATVPDAVAAVESHITRGDLLAAENELQWAVDALGERTELRNLEERLQRARMGEREQAPTSLDSTRPVGATIGSVVAEIEAKLARGELHAAEVLLYEGEASWGEQEIFLTLHDRLVETRRRDRAARGGQKRRET